MNILLRRAGALGDVLQTTPIARRLRRENPDAIIHIETHHHNAYEGNPHINGFVDYIVNYDRVVDLNMAYERNRGVHQVDAMMQVAFGDTGGDREIILKFTPRNFIEEPYVVVHPARSWPSRTFSSDFWQSVVDDLRIEGFTVVITGTLADFQLTNVIDMRGQLRLADQAALINSSLAFLCSDSGVLSVACATRAPIVCLFTITRSEFIAPWRNGRLGWNYVPVATPLPCYGCSIDEPPSTYFTCRRRDNACVESIPPRRAVVAVLGAIIGDERRTQQPTSSTATCEVAA